ncbi:PAQR family membrane homeostasis protein TrhA [Bacillus niameyensis]|uniref:PAQR family membrane homeostasis protein TrhA n=1 Tax=Bacillus niameyensis TaxID=1522308 RepID=UPI0007857430|nr:hemolysin III family protein [Bacillus niameyensis]
MTQFIREPFNALSHLAGALLSVVGLILMVIKVSLNGGSALQLGAAIMFGVSLILLYSASTTYHLVIAKDKVIAFLRRFDHSMIFALIAGSYAPFCLISLKGKMGWIVFSIVAVIALSGILFKMVWFNCPRWLSTVLYIALGWVIVIAIVPLSSNLGPGGLFLLIFGGILYTIGGVIYGLKPKFLEMKHLGFHEIFHLFILAGSLCHFFSVYYFVL